MADLWPVTDVRRKERIVIDLVALALVAASAILAIRATYSAVWPFGVDAFRDLAAAQTMADGAWLSDPYYRGEYVWYSPLAPALIAVVSLATGLPVGAASARMGPYVNLIVPIAFYLLVVHWFGRRVALAALIAFLVVGPEASHMVPTYSPWVFGHNLAQGPFYLGLMVLSRFWHEPGIRWGALLGILMGLTLLCHGGPAVVLAGVSISLIASGLVMPARQSDRWSLAGGAATVAVVAVSVASPYLWSVVWHYGSRIRNPVPMNHLEPELLFEHGGQLVAELLPHGLSLGLASLGLGVAYTWRRETLAARFLLAWFAVASGLFVYAVWVGRLAPPGAPALPVPAHHFLLNARAAGTVGIGIGLAAIAMWAGRMPWGRLRVGREHTVDGGALSAVWVERAMFALLLILLLYVSFPAYVGRAETAWYPRAVRAYYADESWKNLLTWLRSNTMPADVVLAPDNAAKSIIGVAGRKSVAVDASFSNPFVELEPRRRARDQMLAALDRGDCRSFRAVASLYHVTHVLWVSKQGEPAPPSGVCGLTPCAAASMIQVSCLPR